MNKILFSIFITIILICNSVYAETVKSSKKIKSTEHNKSDEEWLKAFMQAQQELKEEKVKTKEIEEKGKTLDEINKLLGVDKQK
jgi:galactose-1-phosphate uridylyltransferase